MKRVSAAIVLAAVLLCGCADGSFTSVKPHQQPSSPVQEREVSAKDQQQLYDVLDAMVRQGQEEAVVFVSGYDQSLLEMQTRQVCAAIEDDHPIGAYAVDWISFRQGKSDGQPVLIVYIHYIHGRAEISRIRTVANMDDVSVWITKSLVDYDTGLVLQVQEYQDTDLVQMVESIAQSRPHQVIEMPQVTAQTYPNTGDTRVIELHFTYQNNRNALRSMQEQVTPIFEEAVSSAEGTREEQYQHLASFLTERFEEYRYTTSITPAYSLLMHGVGDSRSFAVVYAAMCHQAGLECLTVSGTKDGASHYWNIICLEEGYRHLDLHDQDLRPKTDREMEDLVWDYSAYPACQEEG